MELIFGFGISVLDKRASKEIYVILLILIVAMYVVIPFVYVIRVYYYFIEYRHL